MALRRIISTTLSPARISSESPYKSRLHCGKISSSKSAIRTSSSPFYTKTALTGLVASRGSPPYTTISPIASGNGNREEKDSGMTRMESNSIQGSDGLQGSSFVAEAAVGRVECTGRGCRPIFDDDYTQDTLYHHKSRNAESVKSMWSDLNYNTVTMCPDFEVSNAAALVEDCCSVKQAFEAALEVAPGCDARLLSTYTPGFAWNAMGDSGAAEELYSQALGVLRCDVTDLLASHAHFLWQTEQ